MNDTANFRHIAGLPVCRHFDRIFSLRHLTFDLFLLSFNTRRQTVPYWTVLPTVKGQVSVHDY